MHVTMQNSELIDKLVMIANGDIELVQRAIRQAAGTSEGADLQEVVRYIVNHRSQRILRPAQQTARAKQVAYAD